MNRMKGWMLKTHCKLLSWYDQDNQLPNQIAWLTKTLPVCSHCTCRPSGPPESQTPLQRRWGLLGHSDTEGRQRPTWEPTILPGPLSFSHRLAGPSLHLQAHLVPKARGSPCTHGTPESPGLPHAQVQLRPSFQPGAEAVGRTAHTETFLVGNLCSLRWICK